ncbi:MAG: hypothetical protein HY554_02175 [Elusimicrobia bacterium]|nr:hypothetical protein [Elusimicrobiota bacterium]
MHGRLRVAEVVCVALAAAGALAGCGGPESRVKKGQVQSVIDQDPARKNYIETIGIGASDPNLPSDTQRKALSRDAAIVKAQYEMLSMVKGVTLEGGITVQRAIETDSTLEAKLKETIKGAEVVKSEFTADNGCVVTVRLPKKRLEEMMGVKFK